MRDLWKNRKGIKSRYILGFVFSGTAAVLWMLAVFAEGFAEGYANTVYRFISEAAGRLFGIVPFSVVEIGLYLLILWLLVQLFRIFYSRNKEMVHLFLSRIFLLVSLLLFLFTANCGINYHKTSFAESNGLHLENYSAEQLAEVCLHLTEAVNQSAAAVKRDLQGVMIQEDELQDRASAVMKNLSLEYPELGGYYPRPKHLLFPEILSVQQITGIYSPFTLEANLNQAITDYNVPFSACHELAHLRGYMQEEEANFIAYLACIHADEADFQYSGNLRGWISCMNVLYRTDWEKWAELRVLLHPDVEADLEANRQFWAQYDGKISEIAEKVNDQYLKVNGQEDGIKSYGRMADLIVAYYIDRVNSGILPEDTGGQLHLQ